MPSSGQKRPFVRAKESKGAKRRSATTSGTARLSRTSSQMTPATPARPSRTATSHSQPCPEAVATPPITPTSTNGNVQAMAKTTNSTRVTPSTRSSSIPRRM